MALGQIANGEWTTQWTERSQTKQFQRISTQFHNWITADEASEFKAERGAITSTFP